MVLILATSNGSSSAPVANPGTNRRTANYQPSIWGNSFIVSNTPEDEITLAHKEQQLEDLKEVVIRELIAAASHPLEQLKFIDAVQRLGVAYHFEKEIEEALQNTYDNYHCIDDINDDLYDVALRFRLRQQGFNISCDIFNKFTDERGRFKEALISDVRGMLGLYEAAHLRVHGEDILAKALAFTTTHLKAMVESLGYHLAEQVAHALNRPIRKGLERLEARWYISVYQDEAFHDKTLLELGKLDFNLVQSLHKEELSNLARWWKELDFATKLPFARDRLVEGYFWMHGVYFEPQYLRGRRILTKVIAMTSILDDIHDAYGTPEELKLFIEAIERWDINSINQLPEYMKLCYVALLDVYKEIEEEMEKEGNQYRVHYAKEVMKNQVRAYFAEAKWLHEEHVPAFEEYMRVALASSGYCLLATTSFVGMGEIATKEAFDWVTSDPKIMSSSNFITRLMDDIKSHKFEQKRGHVASAVECYMKQYGVSEEQVYSEFRKQIENAWLDINQECLKPTAVSMPLLARLLNLTRTMDVIYKEQDSYTHVGKVMRDNIASVFINAVI
ncbi:valencene synthase [Vitis vinifera]|uniref:valencene synthase n=1 Tax=Vitis vinifera TaxID=29760 RepID=UPI00015C97DE|nr:valencene synthase [Vitis vinifera]|eukprot:XP_002274445.2 PREDICTED: valencene synthase [Vitis vinifera]